MIQAANIFIFQSTSYFVSACAPQQTTQAEVEIYVADIIGGDFVAVDKSTFDGSGRPTPNPCDDYPGERTHWFLIDRALWVSTKKQFNENRQ